MLELRSLRQILWQADSRSDSGASQVRHWFLGLPSSEATLDAQQSLQRTEDHQPNCCVPKDRSGGHTTPRRPYCSECSQLGSDSMIPGTFVHQGRAHPFAGRIL